MNSTDLKIVITGFGGVTGAGDETDFRTSWLAGESSVVAFEGRKHEGLPPGFGAPARFVHKDLRGLPGGKGLRPGTMTAHTFRLMDPVSQRMMGVRADMTPQVARIAGHHAPPAHP